MAKFHLGYPTPIKFGRYEVRGYLGGGTFGQVYRCFDTAMKREVAIKKLNTTMSGVSEALLEAQSAAAIEHPNIVKVLDVQVDQGLLIMEYADGGSLADRLEVDPGWVRSNFDEIFLGLCDALRTAHVERLIHRDIKPANIVITASGTAKIADFGIARRLRDDETHAKTYAGSPAYMALEVLREEAYGVEADIHSLGCVIYEVWAAKRAFDGPGHKMALILQKQSDPQALREVNGDVDDLLSDLVTRMVTSGARRIRNIDLVSQQLARRVPRTPAGGVKSIDDLQKELGVIYGEKNSQQSPVYLLGQYLVVLRSLIDTLPNNDQDTNDSVQNLFPRAFGWLCALTTSMNARLGELIWLKYDSSCPYCEKDICNCASLNKKKDPERNADLLEKLHSRRLSQAEAPQTFEQYQAKFRRMFGPINDTVGVPSTKLHAYSEVAEAMDALLRFQDTEDLKHRTVLHLELSDLLAWFFALLNGYNHNYSFLESFEAFFKDGCYACHGTPCVCQDDRGMLTWREITA